MGGGTHEIHFKAYGRHRTATLIDIPGDEPLTRSIAERIGRRPGPHPNMLVCNSVTADARRWILATAATDLIVTGTGEVIVDGRSHNEPRTDAADRRGHRSTRSSAVERITLLGTTRLRQRDIAAGVGVSQQAVAQMSKKTPLRATPIAPDTRRAVLHQWISTIADEPAAPIRTHWYGLDSPFRQAEMAVNLASELEIPVAVTGEVAADQLRPWRVPTRADLYTSELIDLSVVGMVEAQPEEATLTLYVPRDTTLWHTARWWRDELAATGAPPPLLPTADPIIVLRDLVAIAPELDDGAAQQLAEWIAAR